MKEAAQQKIDLAKVESIANWIRRQQKENPGGMKMLFCGKEGNTASALEALPIMRQSIHNLLETIKAIVNETGYSLVHEDFEVIEQGFLCLALFLGSQPATESPTQPDKTDEPENPLLIPAEQPRYFLDERAGCAAVRDRQHPSYNPTYQGLHFDTPDVVAYRHGQQNLDGWQMFRKDILELRNICEKLNSQPQEPEIETPDNLEPQTDNPLLIPAKQFWMDEANSI